MAIYIIFAHIYEFYYIWSNKKNIHFFFQKNANGPDGGELTLFSSNYKILKICLFQLLISQ